MTQPDFNRQIGHFCIGKRGGTGLKLNILSRSCFGVFWGLGLGLEVRPFLGGVLEVFWGFRGVSLVVSNPSEGGCRFKHPLQ